MALSELSPAERHRVIGGDFTDRVRGTKDWDVPSPVTEWTARDVVRHLVEWFPGFLQGGTGITLPAGPSVDDDPVGAWETQFASVQGVLDDPSTAGKNLSNPHIGEIPLDRAIDQFYTSDVFMHTWDLARATGQDDVLEAAYAAILVDGMEPIEEMMRSSGQYGPRVAVPPGSDAQTRLLGFIGRDPFWTP
ncbi:TIGR03086 family metal-binding protein [Cryptosporangium sp. NPDC048952]|uniref:TIGR03086 family metal-binding protein n=1 Tax=Cryptosporangium sp. NPDC048952 TaxID=3363961 RepID=UPI0037217F81